MSITLLLPVAVAFALISNLLPLMSEQWWVFELFAHFPAQYLVGDLLLFGLCLWRRQLRLGAALSVAILAHSAQLYPYLPGAAGTSEDAGPADLRVLAFNLNYGNDRLAEVLEFITAGEPDVVVLEEFTPKAERALRALEERFPHNIKNARWGSYGIALYAKHPFHRAAIRRIGGTDIEAVHSLLDVGGRPLEILGVHLSVPKSGPDAEQRKTQLRALAAIANASQHPLLILGDMNITPWSVYFQQLLKSTTLQDMSLGRGLRVSWPRGFFPFWIPIDHCLYNDRLIVVDSAVSRVSLGSDHYPLIADLRFR